MASILSRPHCVNVCSRWNNGASHRQSVMKDYAQVAYCLQYYAIHHIPRADSRFAPSQWERVLLCNDVSHWLPASPESALHPKGKIRAIGDMIMSWLVFIRCKTVRHIFYRLFNSQHYDIHHHILGENLSIQKQDHVMWCAYGIYNM